MAPVGNDILIHNLADAEQSQVQASFIRCRHASEYEYHELKPLTVAPLAEQIEAFVNPPIVEDYLEEELPLPGNAEEFKFLKREQIGFSIYGKIAASYRLPEEKDFADKKFYSESMRLMDEIRERVLKLQQLGINRVVLQELLKSEDKLSRLVITVTIH